MKIAAYIHLFVGISYKAMNFVHMLIALSTVNLVRFYSCMLNPHQYTLWLYGFLLAVWFAWL